MDRNAVFIGFAILLFSLTLGAGCLNPDYSKLNYSVQNVSFTVGEGSNPVLGNSSAPITIVEFTDYQCPYCRRHAVETFPLIESNYINTGKVQYYLRDFPLPMHVNANTAASAAKCAGEQGKYWEMHKLLFEKQSEWSGLSGSRLDSKFASYASDLGMNDAALFSCLGSGKFAQQIGADLSEGPEYEVISTPTSLIILPKTVDESRLVSILKKYPEYVDRGMLRIFRQPDGSYVFYIKGAFPYSVFSEVLSA